MISRVLSAFAALGLVASGTVKAPQAQVKVLPASDVGIAQGTDVALDLLVQNGSDGRPWPPAPTPPPPPPHHAVLTPPPTIAC